MTTRSAREHAIMQRLLTVAKFSNSSNNFLFFFKIPVKNQMRSPFFIFFIPPPPCRFNAYSLVEFNTSLQLGLTMDLFSDKSFRSSYREFASMDPEDTLYFEVALDGNASFASNVLLHVETCWATETSDPQNEVQGIFLEDG